MKNFLERIATGPAILICLALYICMIVFVLNPAGADMQAKSGHGPIDLEQFVSADHIVAIAADYNPEVRARYSTIEMTADVVYPLIYTLFLGLGVLFFFRRAFAADSFLQRLRWLPFFVIIFDYLENIGIISLLAMPAGEGHGVAQFISIANGLKWVGFIITMVLFLTGLVVWLYRVVSGKKLA